jgi:hypothetical protein
VRFLDRPADRLSPDRCAALLRELRDVAATCFDTVPEYGVLAGHPASLHGAVLALARRPDGTLAGFCAAVRLHVPGVGDVLHLGLTCVRPEDRGGGLTHRLLSKVIAGYLLRRAPWRGAWVTNTASVLSSLGNVALHFEDVHPSPFRQGPPTTRHRHIAATVSRLYRRAMHLPASARFCERRFVFVGANRGTPFHKHGDDARFHHRDRALTGWYAALADLDGGDAVLQVGRVSLAGLARYALRRVSARLPGIRRWVAPRPPIGAVTA